MMDICDEHRIICDEHNSKDVSRSKRKRSLSGSTGKKCKFSGQNDKRLEHTHKDTSKWVTSNEYRGTSIQCVDLVSDDDSASANTSMDNNQVTNIKDKNECSKNKTSQFGNSSQPEVDSKLEFLVQKFQRHGDAHFKKLQNVIEQPKIMERNPKSIGKKSKVQFMEEGLKDRDIKTADVEDEKISNDAMGPQRNIFNMQPNIFSMQRKTFSMHPDMFKLPYPKYLDFDQEEFYIFDDWDKEIVEGEDKKEMQKQNEETCPQKIDYEESSNSSSSDESIPGECFQGENIPDKSSDEVQDKPSSKEEIMIEIESLIDMLFDNEIYFHKCPRHNHSAKIDESSSQSLHGHHINPPKSIFSINTNFSSKFKTPVSTYMDGASKSSDISSEFQPPMDDDPQTSDETIHGFRRSSKCFKKAKICELNRKHYRLRDEIVSPNSIQTSSSYSSRIAFPENLHSHWSKIAFNFEAKRFANIYQPIFQFPSTKFSDIVCSFNILSDYEIIMFYEEEKNSINVCLPEVKEMEKRWLLEEKTEVQVQDADMKRLENLYREIMLDPERKDTFHKFSSVPETRLKTSNSMDIFSNATILNTTLCHKQYLPLTESGDCKLATKIVEVEPESLLATIEQNTLLPLKLKLNAYMHLNEFIPTIIGLPYATAETKIVQSYEYGYLYEKLQNYFIATRDCSFVHFDDSGDSDDEENSWCTTIPDLKDEVESCPLYKTIEVPKTTSSFVESLCTHKSYRITRYENEAKKYLSKATNFENCTFGVLVKQLSNIGSLSVPESV